MLGTKPSLLQVECSYILLTAELALQSRFGLTLGAKLQSVNVLKSSCLGFPSAEIPGMYQHVWKDMFHVLELCKQPADCGARDNRWLFFFNICWHYEENKSLESSRMFKLYDKV